MQTIIKPGEDLAKGRPVWWFLYFKKVKRGYVPIIKTTCFSAYLGKPMPECCKGILSQNSGTDLYPSKDPGKGHGSLLVQSTCFADLEKAYDHASRSVLRESLQEYGVLVLLMRAIR